jgi:hypothetical protein
MNLSDISAFAGREIDLPSPFASVNSMADLMAKAEREITLAAKFASVDSITDLMAKAEREITLATRFAGVDSITDLMAKAEREITLATRFAGVDSITDLISKKEREIALATRLAGLDSMADLLTKAEPDITLATRFASVNGMADPMARAERERILSAQFAGIDHVAELMTKAHVDLEQSARFEARSPIETLPRHEIESAWFRSVSAMASIASAETSLTSAPAQIPLGPRPNEARRRIQRSHLTAQTINARRSIGLVQTLIGLEQLKEARKANRNSRYGLYLALAALAYPVITGAINNPETLVAYLRFLKGLMIALGQQFGYGTSEIMPVEFHDL